MSSTEIEPVQRARQVAAAEALKSGEKVINLCCAHCGGGVFLDHHELVKEERSRQLTCVQCGRLTSLSVARSQRRQKIIKFIRNGIDIPLTR